MSIGTGVEVGAGGGGAVPVLLGFGRDKTVVVLVRGAELWSLPWKVVLASWFLAQHSAALYQVSGSKSDGCPVGSWVIIS
jgi:hypothetical protein